MSYGITPFAVHLKEVESAVGCGQAFFGRMKAKRLLRSLKAKFGDRYEEMDEMQRDEIDEEEGEEIRMPFERAMSDLLHGNELRSDCGDLYGYALEMLCQHYGRRFLSNECWSAMRIEWAETVDAALQYAGVDEQKLSACNHIMFRGPPIAIPAADDWPSIGYLRQSEISPALQALDAADLSELDEEVSAAIAELRGWLKTCQERGCDLVCFCY